MTDLHQTCPRCAGERAHADDCTAALAAVVEALEGERREGESVADAVRRLRRERAEARGALRAIRDGYDHEHHSLGGTTRERCDGPGYCRVCTAESVVGVAP